MTHKAPGKAHRQGITEAQLYRMFPDDAAAQAWFEQQRWGDTPYCPHCGSVNVRRDKRHPTMSHRCRERECRKHFSVRTHSVMARSHLGYQAWVVTIYKLTTSLKSVSSMKLYRDLGISQKTAWYLAHRLRFAFEHEGAMFSGPVEVDESYFGGRRANMSNAKRKALADTGRGPVRMTVVIGAKDRVTNRVRAKVVERTDAETLQGFVTEHTAPGAKVYTDDAKAYAGIPLDHETVKHSLSEYVKGDVHTNGIESLWSMLKRAHKGTFHKLSPKHLDRYVQEFAGRHNIRERDTLEQMSFVARNLVGKELPYRMLIQENGLDSGARPTAPPTHCTRSGKSGLGYSTP